MDCPGFEVCETVPRKIGTDALGRSLRLFGGKALRFYVCVHVSHKKKKKNGWLKDDSNHKWVPSPPV